MSATLVVPDRDPAAPSGGDVYDARVAAHWPADLQVCRAPGTWPHPTDADRSALERLLGSLGEGPVLIDGLVGSAVPELVAVSADARRTGVLVHSTLSAGSGAGGARAAALDALEARSLRSADVVATTSAWSAADLRRRYALGDVVVARPGVDPAPVAPGSGADVGAPGSGMDAGAAVAGTGEGATPVPRLLVLGALTPVKNHAALLAALARLDDLGWALTVVGAAPDPAFADHLRARARDLGPPGRVTWPGALDGAGLDRVWARTDLLVHPSLSETWGLVVTEAHARGIPTVVHRGTGAEEALTWPATGQGAGAATGEGAPQTVGPTTGRCLPGAAVDVEDVDELAGVLRAWLTDGATRAAWRSAALARRARLPGWGDTARVLHRALTPGPGGTARRS